MRRNHLALFLALPSTLAFSLSNFQEITSTLIPLSCLLTYDTQMSDCKKKDFNKGCSDSCVANLLSIQADVQDACSQVTVNSQTLLGIVKNGGIVAALCPAVLSTSTSTTAKPTTSAANTPPQVSVTIPTTSPGVSVQPTVSTSSPTPNSSLIFLTISSSTTSPTSSSTSEQVATTSTTSTTPSAQAISSPTTTSSNKGAAAAGTSSGSTSTPKADPGTGGGSPFDISSGGSILGYNSVWSVALAIAWTGFLFGR